MRRPFLVLVFVFLVAAGTSAWGQCPDDENDRGECDSLIVESWDTEMPGTFPAFLRFQVLITHDQTVAGDSIAGFAIPLGYTHTNPAAYCSVTAWWNTLSVNPYDPAMARSVFRDLPDNDSPVIFNRMFALARDFSMRDWDFKVVDLDGTSHYWFNIVPTGTPDQRWWEGDRALIATMTFRLEDTMTICVDTVFWPPSSNLLWVRGDGGEYVPRDNLPYCFPGTSNDVREIHGSEESRPSEFSLSQNYPNPFNPATNIEFSLIKATHVKLEIFNIVGQKVRTLVDEEMKAGTYLADWDGKDEKGKAVSSGIYFYRMEAGDFSDMKKMLLVK